MARRVLVAPLASGLVLVILCVVLLAAGRLLGAMGDDAATVVDRCALVAAVLAGVNLVLLVYVLGYLMVRVWEEPEDK